jgi:hypothetical protein
MKTVSPASVFGDLQAYEDQHVHAVYDQIATHFSSTRYKVGYWFSPQGGGSPFNLSAQPWPIIAKFISELPSGWIGLDSGTGNGKYLPLPADRPRSVLTVGLDRSRSLLLIARNARGEPTGTAPVVREVVWGDVLDNGWRAGAFVSDSAGRYEPRVEATMTGLRYLDSYDTSPSLVREAQTSRSGVSTNTRLACTDCELCRDFFSAFRLPTDAS